MLGNLSSYFSVIQKSRGKHIDEWQGTMEALRYFTNNRSFMRASFGVNSSRRKQVGSWLMRNEAPRQQFLINLCTRLLIPRFELHWSYGTVSHRNKKLHGNEFYRVQEEAFLKYNDVFSSRFKGMQSITVASWALATTAARGQWGSHWRGRSCQGPCEYNFNWLIRPSQVNRNSPS